MQSLAMHQQELSPNRDGGFRMVRTYSILFQIIDIIRCIGFDKYRISMNNDKYRITISYKLVNILDP